MTGSRCASGGMNVWRVSVAGGEGGAGAVRAAAVCSRRGPRGIGGVSGAGDGPDGGEPPAGDIVGDGGQHRGTGCGAAAGRSSVRQADESASMSSASRYLTIVVDHDERRVVWAGGARGDAGGLLRAVGTWWLCADRVGDEAGTLRAWVPHERVVFDRTLTDRGRRSEQRRLASEPEDAKALKGTRYALLKHPARLRPGEARRLETLRRKNGRWTVRTEGVPGDDPGAGDTRGCAGAAR